MPRLSFVSNRKRAAIVAALTTIVFLSGGSIYYWNAKSVRLTHDGKTRRIFTSAPTIQEFLDREKIVLGPLDFVTPALQTPIGHNTAAKVTRVVHEDIVLTSTGPAVVTWHTRTRQNLRWILAQKGHEEVRTEFVQVIKHDGLEIARAALGSKKKRVPFYTLTLLNNQGRPVKRYNLLEAKMLRMRATGYYVGEKYVPSDTTFLGIKLRRGLVAVDPKVIPLRSRLYVEGYGYAYAADTGSAIKKLRIDLAVKDKKEEVRYNRKNVPVYILEKAKTW
jgi:3D (Asp-Asp-Asp) domain-containing protein